MADHPTSEETSSDVLGVLAALARRVEPTGGRLRVNGLDPRLREMLRIRDLDPILDVDGCEPRPPFRKARPGRGRPGGRDGRRRSGDLNPRPSAPASEPSPSAHPEPVPLET
jgi:hypothetical protein